MPADSLVDLGVADFGDGAERTLSSDRSEPPFPEFFVSGDEGEQLRFVLLTDEVPQQLTGEIPIGDQTFTVDGNVADQVDPASLIDIGCVGPFPLRAANDVTAPYSELYAPVGNGLLRLVAQETGQEDEADAQGDADAVETGTPEDESDGDPADDDREPTKLTTIKPRTRRLTMRKRPPPRLRPTPMPRTKRPTPVRIPARGQRQSSRYLRTARRGDRRRRALPVRPVRSVGSRRSGTG